MSIRQLFARSKSRNTRRRQARRSLSRRPVLEQLETRRLMAVDIVWPAPGPNPAADEIEILSVGFSDSNPGMHTPQGENSSPDVTVVDLAITQLMDSTTPQVFESIGGETPELDFKIELDAPKKEGEIEFELKFEPNDFSLNYDKFQFKYTLPIQPQTNDPYMIPSYSGFNPLEYFAPPAQNESSHSEQDDCGDGGSATEGGEQKDGDSADRTQGDQTNELNNRPFRKALGGERRDRR
ncbi:MAG: hypothetical protein QGG36_15560 [Pirellulaceae bacterium]|jgi:hypothetical protein|nr:hypothetical protein [Pirellulaceae bacterium]MDP7017222.1 hypothetical protein [Pirellulaceae bacterium]